MSEREILEPDKCLEAAKREYLAWMESPSELVGNFREEVVNKAAEIFYRHLAVPATEVSKLREEVERLTAENAEYKRWFDGDGCESKATVAAQFAGLNSMKLRIAELEQSNAALAKQLEEARTEYKSLGLAAHDNTPAEMICTIAELWGNDQERCRAAEAALAAMKEKKVD